MVATVTHLFSGKEGLSESEEILISILPKHMLNDIKCVLIICM